MVNHVYTKKKKIQQQPKQPGSISYQNISLCECLCEWVNLAIIRLSVSTTTTTTTENQFKICHQFDNKSTIFSIFIIIIWKERRKQKSNEKRTLRHLQTNDNKYIQTICSIFFSRFFFSFVILWKCEWWCAMWQ